MAGTDKERKMIAEGPAIVLVEPQIGENIGMAARAMANFGLAELRLVNPRDGWPSAKARATASGAVHVIDGAKVYANLSEAVGDLGMVLATTAREREMIKPVIGPRAAAMRLRDAHGRGVSCGILFGRERWGLNNEEVALAEAIITYPVNPGFASLNIAQAVLLVAYEWMASQEVDRPAFAAPPPPPASKADLLGLMDHLETALDATNYFHPPEKRERMALNLRSILAKANLSEPEVRTLRGVIASLERRWLREAKP